MPRGVRQFEIGGIYHIINRGVEKRTIFLKSQDYSRFILGLEFFNDHNAINLWELVTKAARDNKSLFEERRRSRQPIVELMAFALMPNHYHLIVREITDGGTSLFMRKMGGYSMYFNKQYDRVGPLFQSRFKAVHIQDDTQLNIVFLYVHTNPVELKEPMWKERKVQNFKGAIDWLEEYRWSSYHDYMKKFTFPHATQRDFFLDFYGGEKVCREAVENWIKMKARITNVELTVME